MTKKNLTIWDANADIDPSRTKPISGRDYRGTSPDPQEIIRMLTKQFGPVGKGFGWTVVDSYFQPLGEGVLLHWCRITFWWSEDGSRHEFEAYGQTKAAYMAGKQDARYLRTDEDAPKKSLTDAITKAASQLGFAANIYLGLYDDNRYVHGLEAKFHWNEMQERDSRFWDPVLDELEDTAEPEDIARIAAKHILSKVTEYKTVASVIDYVKYNPDRFKFIETNAPDVFADLKADIEAHRAAIKADADAKHD